MRDTRLLPGEKTVTVLREDFAALSRDWEALLGQSPARSIFYTPQWHKLCWEHLNESAWDLALLSIRDGDTYLGIAPLRRRGDTLSFIGNVEVSDYADFVLLKGEEDTFFQVLLDALRHEDWKLLDLHGLIMESPTFQRLPAVAESMGFSVTLQEEFVAPGMDLPDNWESFLASLSKKSRHELRRKLRRLEANATFSYYALAGEALEDAMGDFLRLHRLSSEEKQAFMGQRMEAFFRALVARLGEEGWAKLYFMEVGGQRVSTALCFEYQGETFLYNSGFDPAYGWLSVGLLLKAFCVRDAIASGSKRFDFLRGSEHYKYELGGVDLPIYRCLVERP